MDQNGPMVSEGCLILGIRLHSTGASQHSHAPMLQRSNHFRIVTFSHISCDSFHAHLVPRIADGKFETRKKNSDHPSLRRFLCLSPFQCSFMYLLTRVLLSNSPEIIDSLTFSEPISWAPKFDTYWHLDPAEQHL